MPCLDSRVRAKYEADLVRVQTQITKLTTAIDSATENAEVEEYSFNSGEGSQRTKRRSIKELLDALDRLESREMRILKKLYGRSIVNVNLRRKKYSRYYY